MDLGVRMDGHAPPSPRRCGRHITRSDLRSPLAHSVAAPFQITTAALGCDLGLENDASRPVGNNQKAADGQPLLAISRFRLSCRGAP